MRKYRVFKKVLGITGSVLLALVAIIGLFIVWGMHVTKASAKEVYLGECKVSAYSPACNTPRGSRNTSTGHTARAEHTIAVDMYDPLVSYGAKLRFEGSDVVYTVEDCGNLLHYGRDLDVFFDTPDEVDAWGVRWKKVYLVLPDNDKSKAKQKSKKKDKKEETYWYENTAMCRAQEVASIHTVNHGIVSRELWLNYLTSAERLFDIYSTGFLR